MVLPNTIRKATHTTGKTHIAVDLGRMAGTPGMRIARKSHKPYYEGRKNRSDVNPKKRL